jgi:hypothetical protein
MEDGRPAGRPFSASFWDKNVGATMPKPICPVHAEELRVEHHATVTGFCTKCLRHYELCRSTQHMWPCVLLKDHEEENHVDERGRVWPREKK